MFKPRRTPAFSLLLLLFLLSCILLLTFHTSNYLIFHNTHSPFPESEPLRESQHVETGLLEQPLLTLVLTTHNVQTVLNETLSTISLPINTRILLIDDGSTDSTVASLKSLNSSIHALSSNTLGGVGTPSNLALSTLSTKYVAFLDGDDLLTSSTLAEMVTLAEKTSAEIVYADFTRFRDNRNRRTWLPAYDHDRWPSEKLVKRSLVHTVGFGVQAFGMSPVPWRKLYNVDFLRENALEFPEGDFVFEDNAFHWLVTTYARRVVYYNRSVVAHRLGREGQTTSAFKGRKYGFEDREDVIRDRKGGAGMVHYLANQNFVGFRLLDCRLSKMRCNSVRARFLDWVTGAEWVEKIVGRAGDDKIANKFASIKRRMANYWRNVMMKRFVNIPKGAWKTRNLAVKKAPELSIVVPVFNDRDFIDGFLENVSQLTVSYELIFVDNNSTDGSLRYLERVTKDEENSFVLYTGKPGAGRARNLGLLFAEGRHVIFLDSDDSFNTEVLDDIVHDAQKNGAEVTMFRYELEYVERSDDGYAVQRRTDMFDSDINLFNRALSSRSLEARREAIAGITNYPWNKLVTRELLTRENIFFGSTQVNNDVLFHWHAIASAKSISVVDETVTTHRKFENGGRITDMKGAERVQLADALAMTNRVLLRTEPSQAFLKVWERFVGKLLKWGRGRVGDSWIDEYERRENVVKRLVRERESGLVLREI